MNYFDFETLENENFLCTFCLRWFNCIFNARIYLHPIMIMTELYENRKSSNTCVRDNFIACRRTFGKVRGWHIDKIPDVPKHQAKNNIYVKNKFIPYRKRINFFKISCWQIKIKYEWVRSTQYAFKNSFSTT